MYYSMTDINTKSPLSLGRIVNVIYIPQKYRKLRTDRLTNVSLEVFNLKTNFMVLINKLNTWLPKQILLLRNHRSCLHTNLSSSRKFLKNVMSFFFPQVVDITTTKKTNDSQNSEIFFSDLVFTEENLNRVSYTFIL